MKSCRQISIEWQLAERTVTKLCKDGRIPGAIKKGKSWQIPDDAERPKDQRVTTGKYIRSSRNWYFIKEQEIPYGSDKRKPLPIGISEYIRAVSNYYYVDKTLMIKELLDRKHLVTLFTRPRRFGKTLNMDMLRVFFEKTTEDTSQYFRDKAIWQCGTEYTMHQGKYPVIYLTFKDVKFGSWADTLEKIKALLQEEFSRHGDLLESEALADYEKAYYRRVLDGSASLVDLTSALKNLSKYLAAHHQIAPIIIIDEYDTPIQEGYACDFYHEIISFMRTFFSGGFKDNQHLSYGFMTGILRITQESIFSGMNNLFVNTVMDNEYDDCFGFTESEVSRLLSYYGFEDKMDELREWYDGYLFGQCDIFNPWSVINYVTKGCEPQAYWVSTSRNEILKEVLNIATEDENENLHELLAGKRIYAIIDQNIIYQSLSADPANIYSLLLVAGYLKVINKQLMADGSYFCEIAIPNKEIAVVYKKEIFDHLQRNGVVSRTTAVKIKGSLRTGSVCGLQDAVGEYLKKSASYYDLGTEAFYHGLMLGLIALLDDEYYIRSNRESGEGRFDICLEPKDHRNPGVIMEFKAEKGLSSEALENLAVKARDQIEDKHYDQDMKNRGIEKIMKLGVAFSGKEVKIIS